MTGVVLLGVSIGTMGIPYASVWFISIFGWRHSYILIGLINVIGIIAIAQLLISDPEKLDKMPYGANLEAQKKPSIQGKGYSLIEALHMNQFYLLCGIFFCFFFCINTVLAHIVLHATDMGILPTRAAHIMVAFGVGSIIGRIVNGILGDKIGNKRACFLCFVIMSADMFYLTIAAGLSGLICFGLIMGFVFAGIGALMSPLTADCFGLKYHGLILGIVYASDMVGGALGPVMAGGIFDVRGSYEVAFFVCGIVGIVGALLVWTLETTIA